MTDFERIPWKTTSKGQRTALGPDDLPRGTYTFVRDWGNPNLPGYLPRGSSIYLTTEQATRMQDYIVRKGI